MSYSFDISQQCESPCGHAVTSKSRIQPSRGDKGQTAGDWRAQVCITRHLLLRVKQALPLQT